MPLIGGLLLAVAGEGPDFGHYADWAWAALHGDIFDLRSNVLSPEGVPFTIASAGPGLLFATGKLILFPLPFSLSALATGWVAAITFWASALVLLRHLAGGNDWLALFGAGVLFVGTHAGLYSHAYSTEVFATAAIALLWAFAMTRERWRLVDCAAIGALAGVLILVRPHVVLYAAPALWLAVFSRGVCVQADQPRSVARWLQSPLRVWRLLAVAAPIAMAAAQYAVVNRWMTGVPWHPPYVYGGGGFSSVNMADPEIAAVLTHPLHGLLSYHPIYGVAFIAVLLAARRTGCREPWWWMTVLAVLSHVWVQAGWYIWWLGGSTFGMRGMAPAALPLVAGLVAVTGRDYQKKPGRAAAWMWASLIACGWSYSLLLQGNSRFLSWRELLASQAPALVTVALIVCGWAYWAYRHRSVSTADVIRLARAIAVGLIGAILFYLVWQFAIRPSPVTRGLEGMLGAGAVLLGLRTRPRWRSRAVAAIAVILFAVQAGLFWRLALRTERTLGAGAVPPRQFDYVGASPVDELRVTYAEYLEIPGFDDRKEAFRRFLQWQDAHMPRKSPPPDR
jgi:hypothetical protein